MQKGLQFAAILSISSAQVITAPVILAQLEISCAAWGRSP
jgi:hypothetical protein